MEEVDMNNLEIISDSESENSSLNDPTYAPSEVSDSSDDSSGYDDEYCTTCGIHLPNECNQFYVEDLDCYYCEDCFNE